MMAITETGPVDHRCGTRIPLNLEVVVQSRTFGEVRGQIRDVSIGGMRIEVGADFGVYQPVTVEFSFPRGSSVQRWQAIVVHAASGSIGVMFEFLRTSELAKLIELLCAADLQAAEILRPSPALRRGPAAAAPDHSSWRVASVIRES